MSAQNSKSSAKDNNIKVGLTGLFVHKDGQFMQLIEGPEDVVRTTLKKIKADTRHKNIATLHEGTTDERQFSEWSMGFRDLNSPGIRAVSDFS